MSLSSMDPQFNVNATSLAGQQRELHNAAECGDARTVAVLGATGFLGRAILAELKQQSRVDVIAACRQPQSVSTSEGMRAVHLNLSDPASLRAVVADADWVVHVANYIGRDAELMTRVNVEGTRAIVAAASEVNAMVLYISTTSVYGHGPFRGQSELEISIAPVSALSRSRARAEELVLAANGVVLRPHLTYGIGDRWFIPTLSKLVGSGSEAIVDSAAVTSVMSVRSLGQLVRELIERRPGLLAGNALHASHPQPVAFGQIIGSLAQNRLVPAATLANASILDKPGSARPKLTGHQIELLSTDHWFSSEALWSVIGHPQGPPFSLSAKEALWYQQHLGAPSR